MRRLRWLFDWRTGAVIASTVFVALLTVAVVVSAQSTRAALDANQTQRRANEQQVRELNGRITTLETIARDDSEHISDLVAEVSALQEQVRQLGGKPVVVAVAGTTTPASSAPHSTPTTAPPPTTTTTTVPCLLPIGRCLHP